MDIDKEVLEKAVWKTLDILGKVLLGIIVFVIVAIAFNPIVTIILVVFCGLLFAMYHSLLMDKRFKMGDWDDRNKK